MNFPIAIRTYERPFFLALTLHSLMATKLPEDCEITIFDDCSRNNLTKQYLFSNDVVEFKDEFNDDVRKKWVERLGDVPILFSDNGLKDKFNVIQPQDRKGVRGFIFWIIDYMMKKYPNIEAIHVVEADVLFNEDWYFILKSLYYTDDKTGLLSCYDSRCDLSKNKKDNHFFRCVKRTKSNNWSCYDSIGGVHYLVSRKFYEKSKDEFQKKYHVESKSGDTFIQMACISNGFKVMVSNPSYIQHVGFKSTAWSRENWPFVRNFKKPYAWINQI